MAYSQIDVSTTLNNAKTVLDAFLRNKISRHTDSNDEVFKRIFTLRKAIEYNPYDFGSTAYEDLVGELNSVLEVFGYLLPHEPLVDEFVASDVTGLVSYPPIITDSTIRTTTTYSSYKIEQRIHEERLETDADIAVVQGEVDALETRVGTAEANIVNQGVALGELTDRVTEAESDILALIGNDTTLNNRITTEVDTLQTQINTANSEIDALQAEIEDEENIKGGYRAVATLTDLYTIDPKYLKQNVTMAYVADTGKEYRLTSLVNAGNSTGWTEVIFVSSGGSGSEVISFNGRVGAIVLTSADVTTALGYTPFNYATSSDSFIKNQATLQTGSMFYVDYGKFSKGVVLGGGALTTEIGTGEAGFYIGNLSGVSNIPTGGTNDGIWGAITGTLSNQTDLQAALDGKVSTAGYNKTNWDTAYGWGNHASAGYALASSLANYLPLTGGILTGALNGTTATFATIKATANLIVPSVTATGVGVSESALWVGNLSGVSDVPSGGVNDGVWGAITGTLSNQTDLQTALDGKLGISATAVNSTKWNQVTLDNSAVYDSGFDFIVGRKTATDEARFITSTGLKSFLGLGSNAYSSTAYVPQSGFAFGTTFELGTMYNSTTNQNVPTNLIGGYSNGYIYNFTASQIQSFLGLGSNAYSSTAYLPLTGGTLTGALAGTYATFSGDVYATKYILNNNNTTFQFAAAAASDLFISCIPGTRTLEIRNGNAATPNYAACGLVTGYMTLHNSLTGTSATFSGNVTVQSNLRLAADASNGHVIGAFGKGLYFYTNDGNSLPMVLTPSGNVGIGTTSPSKKLDVNGDFRCNTFVAPSTTPTGLAAGESAIWVGNLSGITNVPA